MLYPSHYAISVRQILVAVIIGLRMPLSECRQYRINIEYKFTIEYFAKLTVDFMLNYNAECMFSVELLKICPGTKWTVT